MSEDTNIIYALLSFVNFWVATSLSVPRTVHLLLQMLPSYHHLQRVSLLFLLSYLFGLPCHKTRTILCILLTCYVLLLQQEQTVSAVADQKNHICKSQS